MLKVVKAGKHVRVYEARTGAEKFKLKNSVLIKAEDSIQAERLARKIITKLEEK